MTNESPFEWQTNPPLNDKRTPPLNDQRIFRLNDKRIPSLNDKRIPRLNDDRFGAVRRDDGKYRYMQIFFHVICPWSRYGQLILRVSYNQDTLAGFLELILEYLDYNRPLTLV